MLYYILQGAATLPTKLEAKPRSWYRTARTLNLILKTRLRNQMRWRATLRMDMVLNGAVELWPLRKSLYGIPVLRGHNIDRSSNPNRETARKEETFGPDAAGDGFSQLQPLLHEGLGPQRCDIYMGLKRGYHIMTFGFYVYAK